MARYKVPKLNSQVRLKKWPAGRISQLKLFLGHLEHSVGISLAAQVEQSPKRKFSEFVPKIVPQEVIIQTDFREIRFFFVTPRGLKDLLFYEYDISATEGFFNVDRFVSPETSYVFSGLNDGFTYYVRVRVVTKNGEVGPWSETVSVSTPLAQARGLYDGTEYSHIIKQSTFYPWQQVFERTYSSIGGTGWYSVDYDFVVSKKWVVDGNVEWTDVEFKWLEKTPGDSDFHQVGQYFAVTSYGTTEFGVNDAPFYVFSVITDDYVTPLILPNVFDTPRRGTFVQKLHTFTEGDYTFRLEGRVIPDHSANVFKSELYGSGSGQSGSTQFVDGSNAKVSIKNFGIFEVLTDD
jgi:hypothetical protein